MHNSVKGGATPYNESARNINIYVSYNLKKTPNLYLVQFYIHQHNSFSIVRRRVHTIVARLAQLVIYPWMRLFNSSNDHVTCLTRTPLPVSPCHPIRAPSYVCCTSVHKPNTLSFSPHLALPLAGHLTRFFPTESFTIRQVHMPVSPYPSLFTCRVGSSHFTLLLPA